MRTYLDCIPCFFKQALEASRLAGASKSTQKKILRKIAQGLPSLSLKKTPPEMGQAIYGQVAKMTKKKDPYLKIKQKSNRLALRLYKKLKNKVSSSKDSLLVALELAIAGNIIDYGVKNSLNVTEELDKILRYEHKLIGKESKKFFDYETFRKKLKKSKTILYLGDNAGETVFDRIFIEEIKKKYPKKRVLYAVKEKPIINDALAKDAYFCGIHKSAEIISSGLDLPGTVLPKCTPAFRRIFNKADIIISKGQGNFEALGKRGNLFFLFMAKCPVVARHVGCNIGDIILLQNKKM